MDYGLVGALMYTAVLGLLIGAVYGRFVRRRDSPVRLLLTAEIATALTLSIFANMFSNSQSWDTCRYGRSLRADAGLASPQRQVAGGIGDHDVAGDSPGVSFLTVTCPACGATDVRPLNRRMDLCFHQCGRCELVFVHPQPTLRVRDKYVGEVRFGLALF